MLLHFEPANLTVKAMEESGLFRFRSSSLCGCYWACYQDNVNPTEMSDEVQENYLDPGTGIHFARAETLAGAKGMHLNDDKYFISRHKERFGLPFFVKGQPDRLWNHFSEGVYFEDTKSLDFANLYMKYKAFKNLTAKKPELRADAEREILPYVKQVSVYAFLYYVWHKTSILKGQIHFIDRNDPLREFAWSIDLWDPEKTQAWLEHHPAIQACLQDDPWIASNAALEEFANPDRFPCHWKTGQCRYFDMCPCFSHPEPAHKLTLPTLTREDVGEFSGGPE